jgi:hypothetical protein
MRKVLIMKAIILKTTFKKFVLLSEPPSCWQIPTSGRAPLETPSRRPERIWR